MRALVTGAAGFIGSHLVDELCGRGHRVVGLDDLSTGVLSNLAHLEDRLDFELVIGSVEDRALVGALIERCDVIFHLAAAVGVKRILDDPIAGFWSNLVGGRNVIETACEHKRPLLITSSSEVYGRPTTIPLREDGDRVLGPPSVARWSYAQAKAAEEFLALTLGAATGSHVSIVRLFNVVGPRQVGDHGMVLPRFVEQAMTGRTVTVYGSGDQTRCFTWVHDVTPELLTLIEHPGAAGEVFNLGSTSEISIIDLARRVVETTGSSSAIEIVPYSRAWGDAFEDTPRRVPDTTKLRSLTGWSPGLEIDEMIKSLIADRSSTGRNPIDRTTNRNTHQPQQ